MQYTGGRSKDKANKQNTETMPGPWKEHEIVSIFFDSVFTTRSLVFLFRDRIQEENNEQWKGTESKNNKTYEAARSDGMHLIACQHHCEAAPHHFQKKGIGGSPDNWRKTSGAFIIKSCWSEEQQSSQPRFSPWEDCGMCPFGSHFWAQEGKEGEWE